MNVKFSYLGRSELRGEGKVLHLSPNLSRDPVAFDAPLLNPLRFREAVSGLHDIVISDLRFKPRDKSAYEQWKKEQVFRDNQIRREAYDQAKKEVLARQEQPMPPDFEKTFEKCRKKYWDTRLKYSDYLHRHDQELWRLLMPCDPVITVAPDVLFFECFSADESSYGCLSVDREAFGPCQGVKYGTTNVDYSWELFNHFQRLRTYRETRFHIDPQGFEVKTEGNADYREEKIDLPPSWLRGFMQINAATAMPMRKVEITREAVYSVCAWLKRNKAKKSPRALRFELLPGRAPRLVLEPWEQIVDSHGTVYNGPQTEPIRVWGNRRLLVLSRLLPLIDGVDVYLLGTGLPHFWVARMGEMRLTLGLSGWTTNDWTASSALDLLAPQAEPDLQMVGNVGRFIRSGKSATFGEINAAVPAQPAVTAAALNRLAHTGQVIYDLPRGVYRWRQIMPMAIGEDHIGPENPELVGSREILSRGWAKVRDSQDAGSGQTLYTGKADNKDVELVLDKDGRIRRGKCECSYFHKSGLRKGACRHLLALRAQIWRKTPGALAVSTTENSAKGWYDFGFLFKGE